MWSQILFSELHWPHFLLIFPHDTHWVPPPFIMKKNSEQVFMLGKALGLELNWNQLHFTFGALILVKLTASVFTLHFQTAWVKS